MSLWRVLSVQFVCRQFLPMGLDLFLRCTGPLHVRNACHRAHRASGWRCRCQRPGRLPSQPLPNTPTTLTIRTGQLPFGAVPRFLQFDPSCMRSGRIQVLKGLNNQLKPGLKRYSEDSRCSSKTACLFARKLFGDVWCERESWETILGAGILLKRVATGDAPAGVAGEADAAASPQRASSARV